MSADLLGLLRLGAIRTAELYGFTETMSCDGLTLSKARSLTRRGAPLKHALTQPLTGAGPQADTCAASMVSCFTTRSPMLLLPTIDATALDLH